LARAGTVHVGHTGGYKITTATITGVMGTTLTGVKDTTPTEGTAPVTGAGGSITANITTAAITLYNSPFFIGLPILSHFPASISYS
jgi:hypothetical protein